MPTYEKRYISQVEEITVKETDSPSSSSSLTSGDGSYRHDVIVCDEEVTGEWQDYDDWRVEALQNCLNEYFGALEVICDNMKGKAAETLFSFRGMVYNHVMLPDDVSSRHDQVLQEFMDSVDQHDLDLYN